MVRATNNAIYRLGNVRRSAQYYSLKQRSTGLYSLDRMNIKRLLHVASLLFLSARRRNRRRKGSMMFLGVQIVMVAYNLLQPRMRIIDRIPPVRISNWDCFTEQQYSQFFDFTRQELMQLHTVLRIPEYFVLDSGTRHQTKVHGIYAFLFFIGHFHCPHARMVEEETRWGYSYNRLGLILNSVVSYIDTNHRHRLQSLEEVPYGKLEEFNTKIQAALRKKFPGLAELPPDAEVTALLLDGTRFKTNRNKGADWRQRSQYNGSVKMHNHCVQGIQGPDGIFYHVFDETLGKDPDSVNQARSGINGILRRMQDGQEVQYCAYGDKGYNLDSHIRSSHESHIK